MYVGTYVCTFLGPFENISHLLFFAKRPKRHLKHFHNGILFPIAYFKMKKQGLKCFLKWFKAFLSKLKRDKWLL
jgi:hypothetical protein